MCHTLPDLSDTPQEEITALTGTQALIDCVVKNGSDGTVIWKFIKDSKAEPKLLTANNVIITEDKRLSIVKSSKTDQGMIVILKWHFLPSILI